MSGHCDFCQAWHSGSCCHPGRAIVAALRAELATAERSGAERGLRERVAAMSVGDCKVLESRILRINADVPYIASEEGFAARIRAAVLAALFPTTPEAS